MARRLQQVNATPQRLHRMRRDGFHVLTRRYSLSRLEKIALILTTTLRCRFGG